MVEMKRRVFVFFAVLFATFNLLSQDIVFKCEAPKVVGLHERFRVSFTINASEVGNFVAPTFRNVNILGGPSTSRSSSVSIINVHFLVTKPHDGNHNHTFGSCEIERQAIYDETHNDKCGG